MLTSALLRRLWPHAPQAKLDAIARVAPMVLPQYGITTPQRLAHFMAQISHENGGGTIIRENMNYSAPRLLAIFGQGHHSAAVTPSEAAQLAHHPEAIAERVYGLGNPKKARELGNTRPGDGYLFRGNGDLQLTGGNSHRTIGAAIGVDLFGNPGQLEDPAISFRCAAAEFQALKCLPAADADDVNLVTRRVNGGFNGLSERKAWLARWKQALPDFPDAPPEPGEADIVGRGAESTEPPRPILDSKEVAVGGTLAAGGGGTILKSIQDAAPQVKDLHDTAQGLGIMDALHYLVANPMILVGTVIAAGSAFIVWDRWRKQRNGHA